MTPFRLHGTVGAFVILVAILLAGCSGAGPTPSSTGPASTFATPLSPLPTPSSTPIAPSATPVLASVVCDYFGPAHEALLEAAQASMSGGNPAVPLRTAIGLIEALAARAQIPAEKNDLTNFASTLDSAALAGGDFSTWDPAYEGFYVKYAGQCGQPIAS